MLVDKIEVQRILRTITAFDGKGCPYVAMQLPANGTPQLYRSSNNGFIHTKGIDCGERSYVSLSDLNDTLRVLQEEKVFFNFDSRGVLRISAMDSADLVVHTTTEKQAGLTRHHVGEPGRVVLDPDTFASLDVKSFKAAGRPTLVDGKLMLATSSGIVMWQGPDSLRGVEISPQYEFLRVISGNKLEGLCISERGYWGAYSANLVMFMAGHISSSGKRLFASYDAPGTPVATIPANQLLYALTVAQKLCGDSDRVDIDPKEGVTFREKAGEPSFMKIGTYEGFKRFGIFGSTAKLIVDALSQTSEEEAVLSTVPSDPGTMRFQRGIFEVNAKVISNA
jgi:hypothetical protein